MLLCMAKVIPVGIDPNRSYDRSISDMEGGVGDLSAMRMDGDASGDSMTLPNFLIIGAHKCGTTSLHSYFKQHPDIYMPNKIKEARFFSYDGENPVHRAKSRAIFPVRTLKEYQALFDDVKNQKAIGEASPEYIRNTQAAERIHAVIPQAKLIASLRNPVDRAYSEYLMSVRSGRETRTFEQVCREDRHWLQRNLYGNNLQRYTAVFKRQQIKVILFENLRDDTQGVIQDCFRFLGVDDTFVPDITKKHNQGGIPKNGALYRLLASGPIKRACRRLVPERYRGIFTILKEKSLKVPPPVAEDTRRELMNYFQEDISRLEDLFQMSFSIWLRGDQGRGRVVGRNEMHGKGNHGAA